jgi:hypothetical protein
MSTRIRLAMDTMRLRAIQHPSNGEELLENFVQRQARLPRDSRRLIRSREMTPALASVAVKAEQGGYVWRAFTDDRLTWMFVAEISLERSRERGRPVLTVVRYDEHGRLEERADWVQLRSDTWQRCDL